MTSQQCDKVTVIFEKNQYFDNVSEFGFANTDAPWQTHLGRGEQMAATLPQLVLEVCTVKFRWQKLHLFTSECYKCSC